MTETKYSNYKKRLHCYGAAFFFLCATFSSCEKDAIFAEGLTPDNEDLSVLFTDDFSVEAGTFNMENTISSGRTLTPLGNINDADFGFSRSAIITQIGLISENTDLSNLADLTVDSVNLSLVINSYYGELVPLDLNVFEITDALDATTDYFTNSFVNYDNAGIGSVTGLLASTDSIDNGGTMSAPAITIPLDVAFGTRLLTLNEQNPTDAAFKSAIKGIAIATDQTLPTATGTNTVSHSVPSETGTILYVPMTHDDTKITVYFRDGAGTSYTLDYIINTDAANYSVTQHDYTGTSFASHLDSYNASDFTYIQGLGGLETKLNIDLFAQVTDQNIGVVNAEIVIPVTTEDVGSYSIIDKLIAVPYDNSGELSMLADWEEGGDHFGGTYDAVNKEYRLNVTRHVQELFNQKAAGNDNNHGFSIRGTAMSTDANRCELIRNSTEKKIKFELSYTKY